MNRTKSAVALSHPIINVALVDDHTILRNGIKYVLEMNPTIHVSIEASNGQDLMDQLKTTQLPDIAVVDITMPVMDGFQTIKTLNVNYPSIRSIVLTRVSGEDAITNMINDDVRAYISKSGDPKQLTRAILDVYDQGVYFNEFLTKVKYRRKDQKVGRSGFSGLQHLTLREVEFIKLCATELSYAEIGAKMNICTKTAENYKDRIFQKLEINNRNSLTLFAIKNGLYRELVSE